MCAQFVHAACAILPLAAEVLRTSVFSRVFGLAHSIFGGAVLVLCAVCRYVSLQLALVTYDLWAIRFEMSRLPAVVTLCISRYRVHLFLSGDHRVQQSSTSCFLSQRVEEYLEAFRFRALVYFVHNGDKRVVDVPERGC